MIAVVAGFCLSINACSTGANDGVQANEFAIQACTTQAVASREGFDPNAVTVEELLALAGTAILRSQLADQAAASTDRWLLLAEASSAIAVFAQQLLRERVENDGVGGAVSQGTITARKWDQYKSASNICLAECQSVIKDVPGSDST